MKKTGILLLAAVLFLAAAGWLSQPLLERRQAFRPADSVELRDATPWVAFATVALGGFRGILADLLWLRVIALQDEGRYFEITQLADWITRLEPTFTEVWSYHAWNMAYNIGLLFENPEDRWRWIENAHRMLRDGGVRYNPDNPRMCWEMGWLFFNRIGGFADEAAGYYQQRLAASVEPVLPGGALKALRPDEILQDLFRMDGAVMATLDRAFAPLDWRLPESHSAYWAWVGRDKAKGRHDLILDRLLYQSLIASCIKGRLVYVPESEIFVRLARVDLFIPTLRLLEETRLRYPDDEGVMSARDFTQRAAIFHYYIQGLDEGARQILTLYRAEHPEAAKEPVDFVMAEAAGSRLLTGGFLEQLEGLFFEAETQRRLGQASLAERMDTMGKLSYEGVARKITASGQAMPVTLDQLRERGRSQAGRFGAFPKGQTP
jgi:hypothetical protein